MLTWLKNWILGDMDVVRQRLDTATASSQMMLRSLRELQDVNRELVAENERRSAELAALKTEAESLEKWLKDALADRATLRAKLNRIKQEIES